MDMKKLLEAVTKFSGEPKQKPGDQVRGTDVAKMGTKEHPFKGKLVGGAAESILKDLSKGATPKTKEQELSEQFADFLQALEEEKLGVHDKRPSREGSRPAREYTKDGQPSKRYTSVDEADASPEQRKANRELWNQINRKGVVPSIDRERYTEIPGLEGPYRWKSGRVVYYDPREGKYYDRDRDMYLDNSEAMDETRGHEIVKTKLQDIERAKNPKSHTDDLEARADRAKAEYAKYVAKMKEKNPNYVPLYKMDEAGANNPPQQNTASATPTPQAQTQQAKNVAQGTQALKNATGSTAPTDTLAKAIDSASQGTAINAKDAQTIEPMMDVMKQVAQDPNLANQFKSFADKARNNAAKTNV